MNQTTRFLDLVFGLLMVQWSRSRKIGQNPRKYPPNEVIEWGFFGPSLLLIGAHEPWSFGSVGFSVRMVVI